MSTPQRSKRDRARERRGLPPKNAPLPGFAPLMPCPYCHGSGREMDMDMGRTIVCRKCDGRRFVEDDYA